MNKDKIVNLPIIIAISLAIGLFIGSTFFGSNSSKSDIGGLGSKYKEILLHIDRSYVDKVDIDSLSDYGITKMLEKLDPHTVYLPAKEAEIAQADLKDGFDGIGVEFNIAKDSLFVISALAGGPSETAGIQTGDIILKANETPMIGSKLNSNLVFANLRGQRGTTVKLLIKRKGIKTPMVFNVKRDKIPTYTIDAAYLMPDNKTGYIKINRFGETTYDEFKLNLSNLKTKGMSQLLIDLRGNPGGYMDKATDVVDELVGGTDVIVYTKGKDSGNNYKVNAGKTGIFEKGKIVVLVDEGSASASEIVSGSLQDFDRATIVGRRTFGKGLVQAPIHLSDGSELRLTISRYFIPSGRGIQKPYVLGNQKDYFEDISNRHSHKELFVKDSIKNNQKLKFKTKSGRTVYGGGGITPDVFVPEDTTYITPYLGALFGNNILREYVMNYYQSNKSKFTNMKFEDYSNKFVVTEAMMNELKTLAKARGVKVNDKDEALSRNYIKRYIKAILARNIWKSDRKTGLQNEYYKILNKDDVMMQIGQKQINLR